MTLYELVENITICGNINIVVFDEAGEREKEIHLAAVDCLDCYCNDLEEVEDLEVTYIYHERGPAGMAWVVIELQKEG